MSEIHIKYGEYTRKSMENADRQILSLEDQHRDLVEVAVREKLGKVVTFDGESRTAMNYLAASCEVSVVK